MAKFLTTDEVYRLLQRELPEGVYPDGAPSAFFSTADMYGVAACVASGYSNAEVIYDNYWPQTAVERISDWELTAFGYNLDAALTLDERQQRVLAKLRTRRGLTRDDMIGAVQSIIGTDKRVEIACWGDYTGSWVLGLSQLGVETYLSAGNRFLATGPLLCEESPLDFGVTAQQWADMQEQAYTYQVRIYAYVLSDAERRAVDDVLSDAEPARSTHEIKDGLDFASMINPEGPTMPSKNVLVVFVDEISKDIDVTTYGLNVQKCVVEVLDTLDAFRTNELDVSRPTATTLRLTAAGAISKSFRVLMTQVED